jgi:hypothetical protein
MNLSDYPYFPYPRDPITRLGFIVGDLIAATIIIGIAFIALKATLHF